MANNEDIPVLNSIYRGAKTGSAAIDDLMPTVTDKEFKNDILTQKRQYEEIGREAAGRMVELGGEPDPVGPFKRAGMKMGVTMNTVMNNETDHLAELMIKGSSSGIVNMTKVINGYPNSSNEAKGLAQKLITLEQNSIEKLKGYLR